MDTFKLKMVEEAEIFLFETRLGIADLEKKLQDCPNLEDRKRLIAHIAEERIKFSQLMAEVVIFKAKFGIYTNPKRLK
jgi:hypothetical protein